MSVAAAVPRRQPAFPLESTLVWGRNGAFGSPQQTPTSPGASPLSQCHVSASLSPAPHPLAPAVQLPGLFGTPSADVSEDLSLDCGFGSDSDANQPGSCPQQRPQSPWQPPDGSARGHSEPTRGGCHCKDCCSGVNGDAGVVGAGAVNFVAWTLPHPLGPASRVAAPAATAACSGTDTLRRRSFAAPSAGQAGNGTAGTGPAAAGGNFLSRPGSRAGSCGGAATVTATILAPHAQPSSPQQPPIPLSSGRSSGSGAGGQPRRAVYGVKASAITSQISAAQRTRAAILIQAAWRGFRIRRLYLRLIVWRLRPPARHPHQHPGDVYCGIREFPPIPDLPVVSLFTQYGRPSHFRSVKRRVWFDMEGPFWRTLPAPPSHSAPASPAGAAARATLPIAAASEPEPSNQPQPQGQDKAQPQPQPQPKEDVQQPQPQPQLEMPPQPPPPQPQQPPVRRPVALTRVQLRLIVPPRVEADVPMSEVERILAGGFWRGEQPAAPGAASGAGGSVARRGGGAGGAGAGGSAAGEGEEGLSMYMRAKMRQEEREAEEALQMLSYEPHDLKHVLGSLKDRTLERLGSLGRTIGETLLGGRGPHTHTHTQSSGSHQDSHQGHLGSAHQWNLPGSWQWHWPGAGHPHSQPHAHAQAGMGAQARSLPRVGRWGSGAVAGSRPKLYCGGPPPSLAGRDSCGGGEWSLRVPLLTVVDAQGRSHVAADPNGGAAPIAINWRRYRNRSHVTRMSF